LGKGKNDGILKTIDCLFKIGRSGLLVPVPNDSFITVNGMYCTGTQGGRLVMLLHLKQYTVNYSIIS